MKPAEKSVPAGRRSLRRNGGIALLAFLAALVAVGLAFFIGNLTPQVMEARRAQKTQEALAQAREALIGYALQYRERQLGTGTLDAMYGYLPMPDVGSSRFHPSQPASCNTEGCAMQFINGAFPADTETIIGRFPWKTVGVEPLRDGHGECLWYIVSANHKDLGISSTVRMNWDTLSHLDVVVADGSTTLAAVLASAHERPLAVIFSPGPPLPGQNRSKLGGDDVTQCGGNYDARNYLDPHIATALGGVTNYLAGTNNASAVTDADAKPLILQGRVFDSGGNFLPNACEGAGCTLVANDSGLPLTGDQLFGAIRKNAYFRTDINAMLDRMVNCLRDQPPPSDFADRIPDSSCYDAGQAPLGYYDHYKEMVFLARPSGPFTVNGDNSCAGALIFAGQRGGTQQRITPAQRADLANYLEGTNLVNFSVAGTAFAGDVTFDRVPPQAPEQDIVRCIPGSPAFSPVESPKLTELGLGQLATYDSGLRRLILGGNDLTTGAGVDANFLFGCAWFSEARSLGSGLRAYFKFQFRDSDGDGSVGFNGFVFTIADGIRNTLNACGAGGSHLGYSGNNGFTPMITFPKIGVEFDQSRNTGFSESNLASANPGRMDPCYATSCGGTSPANSHVAIVYWGHEAAATDPPHTITQPEFDDNVHGFPSTAFLAAGTPPLPPRSPDAVPGIVFKNLRQQSAMGGHSFIYHVRVEVTALGRNVDDIDGRLSATTVRTEAWIDSSPSADQLNALKDVTRPMSLLAPAYPATLSDTAVMYDVRSGSSCLSDPCPEGQACGSDKMCYRPALQTVQLGFTNSQRTTDQEILIDDFFATWLP